MRYLHTISRGIVFFLAIRMLVQAADLERMLEAANSAYMRSNKMKAEASHVPHRGRADSAVTAQLPYTALKPCKHHWIISQRQGLTLCATSHAPRH